MYNSNQYHKICTENPQGCSFQTIYYEKGAEHSSIGIEQHLQGVALSDTTLLIYYFNNTVCHIENCILAFLYTHKHIEPKEGKTYFYSKLTACGQLSHLMEGVNGYIDDATHEPTLWGLKHKELIWLFTKYYSLEELRLFFHSMTDEDVPIFVRS